MPIADSPISSWLSNPVPRAAISHPLHGVHVPTLTFFKEEADGSQPIDYDAYGAHILWMASQGIHGFVCQGSTAEAVALSADEKMKITRFTRDILDKNGYEHLPITAGSGAQTTWEAVELCKQAAESGAQYAICLPPSYFAPSMGQESLMAYYTELADKSPIGIMIYSWPGVSSGLELTSDSLHILAKHPNIIGVKQTDHNVGKMARVVWQNKSEEWTVLGGASDYFLAALAVGVPGTITGLANITPRACILLYDLFRAGRLEEARELQGQMSTAEWSLLSGGIPSIRTACNIFRGYGGLPRRPLPPSPENIVKKVKEILEPMVTLEASLVKAAKSNAL